MKKLLIISIIIALLMPCSLCFGYRDYTDRSKNRYDYDRDRQSGAVRSPSIPRGAPEQMLLDRYERRRDERFHEDLHKKEMKRLKDIEEQLEELNERMDDP